MRVIVLFMIFFGVLVANAQEMDTTYVVNEQGQTIGLIHEKGTVPVLPPAAEPQPAKIQVAAPEPVPQDAVFSDDSTRYYQSLVDRYTASGESKRRKGGGMMTGGAIGVGAGALLMVLGLAQADNDRCGETDCELDGLFTFVAGYGIAIAGGVVFTVGSVIKIVGNSKLRKAERYDNALKRYVERKQTLSLRVAPIFNPVTGALGSRVALEF